MIYLCLSFIGQLRNKILTIMSFSIRDIDLIIIF